MKPVGQEVKAILGTKWRSIASNHARKKAEHLVPFRHDKVTILEGAISTIDALQSEDEISALTIRLEYLNRVIVSEGLPDSLVSPIGEVLSILKRMGRPSFGIKEEHLAFLVENDFKVP